MKTFVAIGVMILSLCQIVFAGIPKISLTLELLPDPDLVYVNDEAYFYCNINPQYLKDRYPVAWHFDIFRFNQDEEAYKGSGIWLSGNLGTIRLKGHTLIIDHVSKIDEGAYRCQIRTEHNKTITSQFVPLKANDIPLGLNRPGLYTGEESYQIAMTNVIVYPSNASQSINNIVEGDFVELICDIHPRSETIFGNVWFYNDYSLYKEKNRSIIFKNIKKTSAGSYKCLADTKRGMVWSDPIDLNVKDRPVKEPRILSNDTKESPESFTIPYAVYKYTIPNN